MCGAQCYYALYSDTITHRTRCVRTPIYNNKNIISCEVLVKNSFTEIKTSAESACAFAFAIRRIVVVDHFFSFFHFFYRFCVPIPFLKRLWPHQLTELAFKKQSYNTQSQESYTIFSSGPRQRLLLLLLYRNFFFFHLPAE